MHPGVQTCACQVRLYIYNLKWTATLAPDTTPARKVKSRAKKKTIVRTDGLLCRDVMLNPSVFKEKAR